MPRWIKVGQCEKKLRESQLPREYQGEKLAKIPNMYEYLLYIDYSVGHTSSRQCCGRGEPEVQHMTAYFV